MGGAGVPTLKRRAESTISPRLKRRTAWLTSRRSLAAVPTESGCRCPIQSGRLRPERLPVPDSARRFSAGARFSPAVHGWVWRSAGARFSPALQRRCPIQPGRSRLGVAVCRCPIQPGASAPVPDSARPFTAGCGGLPVPDSARRFSAGARFSPAVYGRSGPDGARFGPAVYGRGVCSRMHEYTATPYSCMRESCVDGPLPSAQDQPATPALWHGSCGCERGPTLWSMTHDHPHRYLGLGV